jgi:hypothetical protein
MMIYDRTTQYILSANLSLDSLINPPLLHPCLLFAASTILSASLVSI